MASYSRGVTQAILLTAENLAQNAAHNLTTAGLREIVDHKHSLGGSEGTNRLPDLHNQILAHLVGGLVAILQGNEGIDGLAGQLVGDTNNGGFGDHGYGGSQFEVSFQS